MPALVRRAADTLASATTAAEVLEARDMASLAYTAAKQAARFAKAKKAHDDVIAAVHRAQADALEIEAGAKRRLADEYDAAQDRGELSKAGGDRRSENFKVGEGNFEILDSLSKTEIHDARAIRGAEEAEPGIVRATLDTLIEEGQERALGARVEAPPWQ
jgi:hypothetical protein